MSPSSHLLNPPPKSYWKWVKFELVNDWALRHAHWISARTNTSKRGKDVTDKTTSLIYRFLRIDEVFFYFQSFITRRRSVSRRISLLYVWLLEKLVEKNYWKYYYCQNLDTPEIILSFCPQLKFPCIHTEWF